MEFKKRILNYIKKNSLRMKFFGDLTQPALFHVKDYDVTLQFSQRFKVHYVAVSYRYLNIKTLSKAF